MEMRDESIDYWNIAEYATLDVEMFGVQTFYMYKIKALLSQNRLKFTSV